MVVPSAFMTPKVADGEPLALATNKAPPADATRIGEDQAAPRIRGRLTG